MENEIDTPEVVAEALKNGGLVPVVVGLLAFGAGIGLGYILGRRTKYEVIRLPETRPPKVIVDEEALELVHEDTPKLVRETVIERVEIPVEEVLTVNEVPVASNIFAHAEDEDWDIDAEISRRNPLSPYVIHRDEFFAEEMETENYIQQTLTFYAGDNVLVDEDEKPIYNHEMVVGPLRFGHGSGDPNCFYVRNMSRQHEYEVLRDPGHYRVEVLGLEMENQAADQDRKAARQRKFRQE